MVKRGTDLLETYSVAYRSGFRELPHPKTAAITLNLTTNALVLEPTMAARKFWASLSIPYENIVAITLAPHETSTVEGILGGIGGNNSSRLSTNNNIDIHFLDAAGDTQLLRFEMLTGLTVTGQAAIAQQLHNRLDLHGLRARFGTAPHSPDVVDAVSTTAPELTEPVAQSADKIVTLIGQLAQLQRAGALTVEEFAAKKAELLARL